MAASIRSMAASLRQAGYWLALAMLLLTYIGVEVYVSQHDFLQVVRDEDHPLLAVEEKALDTFVDLTTLLVTLATLVIAGASTVFQQSSSRRRPRARDQVVFVLTCLLAGGSILAGLLALRITGWMLAIETYDLQYAPIVWATRVQWGGLLLSAFFAIDLIYHRALARRDSLPQEVSNHETASYGDYPHRRTSD